MAHRGTQTLPIKVSNALQHNCYGIARKLIFMNFKQDLAINVLSYFLYAWFADIVCILDQVNKEILGRHETQGKLCNTDKTRALVQRINNYQLVAVIQKR